MKNGRKLAFALALPVVLSAKARAQDSCGATAANAVLTTHCVSGSVPQFRRFATELDGEHSLDAATVAEQGFGNYTRYTVRLQFTSGHEQSIALNAPPGGLQPEMLDMSGDNIPNDLVLTSKLSRWPLVVLLNDGPDHLTVAVVPGHFAQGGRASGGRAGYRAAALASPRLRLPGLGVEQKRRGANVSEKLSASAAAMRMQEAAYNSAFGRAPPAFQIQS